MGGSSSKPSPPPAPTFSYKAPIPSYRAPPVSKYTVPPSPTPPAPTPRAPTPRAPTPPAPTPPAPTPPAPTPPAPKPVVPANCLASFPVNNYIIPVVSESRTFVRPQGNRVCRHAFKVCFKYSSRNGCKSIYCYRFHVCSFWIKGTCKKDGCAFDHHFNSSHNQEMMTDLITFRYSEEDLREGLRKSLFVSKAMKDDISTVICMDNILKQCKRDNCESFHIDSLFSWEVFLNGKWIPFPSFQSKKIEEAFYDPNNVSIQLSPITGHSKEGKRAVDQVFATETMLIDFQNMSLTSENLFSRVRRLSTPSDLAYFKTVATRWLWYWEDDSGLFHFYTHAVADRYHIIPFSDYIEAQFLKKTKEFSFSMNYSHSINFENMTQSGGTSSPTKIRRRPLRSFQTNKRSVTLTFEKFWPDTSSINTFQRSEVLVNLPEFRFVKDMLEKSLSIQEVVVERVVNPHLWQAYQIKKSQMLKAYNGDFSTLNEQYLFHGTREDVVDKICSENLDWRLYGTNVGNVYGQGTYFANAANISLSYCSRDSQGYLYMFIVAVLVGTAAIGNSFMTFPPIDSSSGKRFDSTVDNVIPRILVKYNLNEYYPVYLVKFKGNYSSY